MGAITQRFLVKLRSELGPELGRALADPNVVEVMRNPDGVCWVERLGEPMAVLGTMQDAQARSLICTVAAMRDRVVTEASPILEAVLPCGSRFHATIPPVTDAPAFTIRKRASLVYSLDDYVAQGIMTRGHSQALKAAIEARHNILIVGGTGSGKTTFANAVIRHMAEATPGHRIVIIEDTAEIQCAANNHVIKRTTLTVSMKDLLRSTLRMRPDRIIVGEVRGGEAEALIKAWNTGHAGGAATIHANSAAAGLDKLEEYIAEAVPGDKRPAIAQAVDFIVFLEKTAQGRAVRELVRVEGLKDRRFLLSSVSEEIHVQAIQS